MNWLDRTLEWIDQNLSGFIGIVFFIMLFVTVCVPLESKQTPCFKNANCECGGE